MSRRKLHGPGFFSLGRLRFRAALADLGYELTMLLVALQADIVDADSGVFDGSIPDIAEALNVSAKWLRPRLERLAEIGAIELTKAKNGVGGRVVVARSVELPLGSKRDESPFPSGHGDEPAVPSPFPRRAPTVPAPFPTGHGDAGETDPTRNQEPGTRNLPPSSSYAVQRDGPGQGLDVVEREEGDDEFKDRVIGIAAKIGSRKGRNPGGLRHYLLAKYAQEWATLPRGLVDARNVEAIVSELTSISIDGLVGIAMMEGAGPLVLNPLLRRPPDPPPRETVDEYQRRIYDQLEASRWTPESGWTGAVSDQLTPPDDVIDADVIDEAGS